MINSTSKRRKELLQEIKKIDAQRNANIVIICEEIRRRLNKDIAKLYELCEFNQGGEVIVKINYQCDFHVDPFGQIADGDVFAKAKEPKGYNIAQFLHDNSITNMGMEAEIISVCPGIKEQLKEKHDLEKYILKEINNIAKEFGVTDHEVISQIQERCI